LGADQPHDLLDLVLQCRRRVVEQQMGLVEEEDQLGKAYDGQLVPRLAG
ncbi:hypothetical protein LCGC14_2171230, partial [marine sediment metagenome]